VTYRLCVRELLEGALGCGGVVLDGGLSNQLADQGQDLSDELWSARLLADDPGQILAAHRAYLRAGARVLITSSYQATFEGFAQRGIGREEAAGLLRRSVELAREAGFLEATGGRAREAGPAEGAGGRTGGAGRGEGMGGRAGGAGRGEGAGDLAWVAASVGPYGAMLADGSEYRGRYGLSVRELERFHRPRIEVLAGAAPDVLALETVPDSDEAQAMLQAAEGTGVPVWLSYTIDGAATRAGQPLADAFALATGNDQVVALGVNCCAPADVLPAIALARAVTGKPVVVYPNSGEHWDGATRSWSGAATFDPTLVRSWRAAGAALIGGCCRVGPAAIAAIAATLATKGVPS
jgi:homocysteine S-methyltransferase